MKTLAAAGTAVVLAVAGVGIATTLTSDSSSTAASTVSIPAPANLRVYEVGSDYAKVSFGPSIVGKLQIAAFDNGKGAKITWGGATDTLYPLGITYDFQKNGTYLWKNRSQTYANVGFTLAVRKFTTCVTPHSTSGFGPKRCVTWTAP